MLVDFLLIWVFWINLQLRSLDDIARRKANQGQSFIQQFRGASAVDIVLLPIFAFWLVYAIGCWLNVLGTLGSAELMLYHWLLRNSA